MAAICTLERVECYVGPAWVGLDNSETYWFAAYWADVFDCKIHVLSLRPTLFGASTTDTRRVPTFKLN